MTARTLVAFHAHPDDEALLTAGTLARAAAAGHRVVLVLATSGEAGLVGDGVVDDGGLGAAREAEAKASADALGVGRLVLLGYGDSGDHEPAGGHRAGTFCAVPVAEAADRLAEVLREEGADLLLADDAHGGYGHPDHVRVHEVARTAAGTVGVPMLQATIDREFLAGGIQLAEGMGLDVPEGFVPPDVSCWYTPHAELSHTVDVSSVLPARRASMAAHATQATGAPESVRTLAVFLGLPEDVFALAFSTEWYARVDEAPLPDGLADLFTPVEA